MRKKDETVQKVIDTLAGSERGSLHLIELLHRGRSTASIAAARRAELVRIDESMTVTLLERGWRRATPVGEF